MVVQWNRVQCQCLLKSKSRWRKTRQQWSGIGTVGTASRWLSLIKKDEYKYKYKDKNKDRSRKIRQKWSVRDWDGWDCRQVALTDF